MSQDVLQDFGKNVVDRVLSIVVHVTVCHKNKRISTYFIFFQKSHQRLKEEVISIEVQKFDKFEFSRGFLSKMFQQQI